MLYFYHPNSIPIQTSILVLQNSMGKAITLPNCSIWYQLIYMCLQIMTCCHQSHSGPKLLSFIPCLLVHIFKFIHVSHSIVHDIMILSVDKLPYPWKHTRDNEFIPCANGVYPMVEKKFLKKAHLLLHSGLNYCINTVVLGRGCMIGSSQQSRLALHGIRLSSSWWCYQMETFSALLAFCAGNSPVTGEFPAQRPVTHAFDVSFDLCLNKQLCKQSWGWWFEMPSVITSL